MVCVVGAVGDVATVRSGSLCSMKLQRLAMWMLLSATANHHHTSHHYPTTHV